MAWFQNKYVCDCGNEWTDEWSCMVDGECPKCDRGNWSPEDSDDLTVVVFYVADGNMWGVDVSPDWAEDDAEYDTVVVYPTKEQAIAWSESEAVNAWLAMNREKPQLNRTWVNGDVINTTITLRTAS